MTSSEKIIVKLFIEYEFTKEELHLEADEVLQVKDEDLQQKYRTRAITRAKNKFIEDLYDFAVYSKNTFKYEVIELKNLTNG